jgi:hypothetical protein
MHRGCRTGQMINLIYLEEERLRDIVTNELESFVIEIVKDILPASGEEIVQGDDIMTGSKQGIAEV